MTTASDTGGAPNTQAAGQDGANGKPADGSGNGADPNANPQGDGKGAAGADGGKPAGSGDQAPGEYKFTAPDGVTLDEARLGEFTTIAKELKLPQDSAQKLVDIAVRMQQSAAEAAVQQASDWAEEVKADKDLGGDKLAESTAVAMKAIELGPPGLKDLLNNTGLGNHPLLFKWAHAVGKALSEDKPPMSEGAGGPSKSAAEILYGASAKT